jgi:integrase/recombinase XerD
MQEVINSYRYWLESLNYSKATIKNNPNYIREFISWSGISEPDQIDHLKIAAWFDYLSIRKHKSKEGGISLNYIKSYHTALNQFNRFLRETGKGGFEVAISFKEQQETERQVLSRREIEKLYEATDYYPDPMIKDRGLLAARERVILGLFYGCGLRRNEGMHITVSDLLLNKSPNRSGQALLYVRKGKNYKERYVPVPEKVQQDFIHYLTYARPVLLRRQQHEMLLTGWYGSPMKGSAIFERLQILRSIAQLSKPVGLHTLRHSIATHLLQSGMKLEQIARFLGHSSLESTQIYTHISHAPLSV